MNDPAPTTPSPPYHAVIVAEGREPRCQTFPDREALVAALTALRGPSRLADHVRVWIFRGERLLTTTPPYSFLLESAHAPTPLFEPPTPGAVEEEGVVVDDERAPDADPEYAAATRVALASDHAHLDEAPEEPLADEGPG